MPLARKIKFGLFPKFLLFFLLIAIIPLLLIEYLTYNGMKDFRLQVVSQSKNIITKLSTENIRQKANKYFSQKSQDCWFGLA